MSKKDKDIRVSLYLFLLFFLILTSTSRAAEPEPPKIGNFVMPYSQQPGPLIGIGENILDKNRYQLLLFADDFAGINQHYIDLYPGILYGITDQFSVVVSTPIAVSYQSNQNKSRGFEDAFVQFEYAFYNGQTSRYYDMATVLASVSAPTGSIKKNPNTGKGSTSFLLGTTYNRTFVDWFFFDSFAGSFSTPKNGTQYGSSYLYQFGMGKNIKNTKEWLLAWLVEASGTYAQKNRVQGQLDPNSGGNTVYVTPSLFFSTHRLILQFGTGWAVAQNLYGNQPRQTYLIVGAMVWTV